MREWFSARSENRVVAASAEHPDGNLLSAFAERALSARERESVAAHLAVCADCRDCLALAFGTSVPAPEPAPARSRVRLWWGAGAAAAAVCGALTIVWFVRQPPAEHPATVAAIAPPPAPPPTLPDSRRVTPPASARQRTPRVFRPPAVRNPMPSTPVAEREAAPKLSLNTAQPLAADQALAGSPHRLAVTPFRQAEPMAAGAYRASASKTKAAASPPVLSVRWTVNGTLQRSTDGGATWETVPVDPTVTFRAVAAEGNQVWAGGSGGVLYHSTDAGAHWSRTGPIGLTGDITRIDTNPSTVTILTSTGERWATSDAGANWTRE